jgi:hypothetical protein
MDICIKERPKQVVEGTHTLLCHLFADSSVAAAPQEGE